MKSAVSKSELIKIALGHADHVIKLHSPDNLDSTVIHKIETLICTAKPENKGGFCELRYLLFLSFNKSSDIHLREYT